MEQNVQMLREEHEVFRTKIKNLISRLYRENVRNPEGEVMEEVALTDAWEYEGLEFNVITEHGLATLVDEQIDDLFTWDDLETESLLDVVQMLEEKDFAER